MRFNRLLIHQCTLIQPGEVTGKDKYNKETRKEVTIPKCPCRLDKRNGAVSQDAYSKDFIQKDMLFLSPEKTISNSTRFKDIMDREGTFLLEGVYRPTAINPVSGRRKLHHYEIILEKVSDSNE